MTVPLVNASTEVEYIVFVIALRRFHIGRLWLGFNAHVFETEKFGLFGCV